MATSEIQSIIMSALQNAGILIDVYTPQTKLKDVIGDSLMLVTFEIELEQALGCSIPAEKFSIDWMENSFDELEALINECR